MIESVDPVVMPAAMLATWIVVAVFCQGVVLHRQEQKTGLEPKGYNLFVFGWIAVALAIMWLGTFIPFFGMLFYVLTGMFLAISFAYLLTPLGRLLLAGLTQSEKQPPAD